MAATEYLSYNGLLYFWQKIKTTFAKSADLATVATSGSYSDLTNKPGLGDLTGDATHRTVSDTEKSTWSGKQDAITFNTAYNASSNKAATMSDVSGAVSGKQDALVFNTAYNSSSNKVATMSDITSALSGFTSVSFSVVQSLPVSGDAGTIYLVASSDPQTNDNYTEWIYVNNGWEKIGETGTVDLTGYLQTSDITTITNAEIDTILAS